MALIEQLLDDEDIEEILSEPDNQQLVHDVGREATCQVLLQGARTALALSGMEDVLLNFVTSRSECFFAPLANQSSHIH